MIFSKCFGHSKKISIICFLTFCSNLTVLSRVSNSQIVPDSTLGNEESRISNDINIQGIISNLVSGGATRGSNLFHSFQKFNVLENRGVYFENPQGIQNIIGRVTLIDPSNVSNILGTLGVRNANGVLGNANLFLINPNGIIFGPGSSLDLGGSFVATTAHAIQFQNQGFFNALEANTPPLLTVDPSGFLFFRGKIAPITNFSKQPSGINTYLDPSLNATRTDDLNGLRVPDGHSLILLGGPVTLDGGGLYSLNGQVEIGSVSGEGLVGLSSNGKNLSLDFSSSIDRDNISFANAAKVYTSGNNSGGGNIRIIGKNIQVKEGSQVISATTGQNNGGTISLDATDSIELLDDSSPNGIISTLTYDLGSAGNINIYSRNLTIDRSAQIISSTLSNGNGGDINITTTGFISLTGSDSGIFSGTVARGVGGNISIQTTGDLILSKDAIIDSSASGVIQRNGDDIVVIPATGTGGNITIKARKSFQIDQGFLTSAIIFGGRAKAGNIKIDTNSLSVNSGSIRVSSRGQAGNLTVNANSAVFNNGVLSANTGISGANISLTILDTLRLENESLISATANNNANGGNITINTPILLALPPTGSEGSDIKATAISGTGGNITINSQGIFGIQQRKAIPKNRTNDIDASSQFGQSGQVQINTTTDPNQGLVELPTTVIDPTTLVAQNPCRRASSSEFTRSGRGGLPPSLSQDLNGESTQVGLVEPTNLSAATPEPKSASKEASPLPLSSAKIVPAQGWVYNAKGEVVLVAYNSAVTGPQRLQSTPAGCPVF
jgi:filamentous hemagglutinin family protein